MSSATITSQIAAGPLAPLPEDGYWPKGETEAAELRPYVPTETLLEINELHAKENAEAEKMRNAYFAAKREHDAAKFAEKEARRAKIAAKKKMEASGYLRAPLYPKSTRAAGLAWATGKARRAAALAAGESPKSETSIQCGIRIGAIKSPVA